MRRPVPVLVLAPLLLVALSLTAPASADTDWTLYGGATLWHHAPAGTLAGAEGERNDLEDDLALRPGVEGGFVLGLRHEVRWAPDVRLELTSFDVSGARVLDEQLVFQGQTFREGSVVDSALTMDLWDVTLDWTPLRVGRVLALRVGVVARSIQGDITVRKVASRQRAAAELSIPVVPMGSLTVEVRPPGDLGLVLETRGLVFGETWWLDLAGVARLWPFGPNLYLGIGYRFQQAVLTGVSESDADVSLRGFFADGGLSF